MKKIFKDMADKFKKPFMSIDNPGEWNIILIISMICVIGAMLYTLYIMSNHG